MSPLLMVLGEELQKCFPVQWVQSHCTQTLQPWHGAPLPTLPDRLPVELQVSVLPQTLSPVTSALPDCRCWALLVWKVVSVRVWEEQG